MEMLILNWTAFLNIRKKGCPLTPEDIRSDGIYPRCYQEKGQGDLPVFESLGGRKQRKIKLIEYQSNK